MFPSPNAETTTNKKCEQDGRRIGTTKEHILTIRKETDAFSGTHNEAKVSKEFIATGNIEGNRIRRKQ